LKEDQDTDRWSLSPSKFTEELFPQSWYCPRDNQS